MNRNIWTFTDSSAMAHARMRSSHQRRSNTEGLLRSRLPHRYRPISCVSFSTASTSGVFAAAVNDRSVVETRSRKDAKAQRKKAKKTLTGKLDTGRFQRAIA